MAPISPRTSRQPIRQREQRSQLEESDSSDTDSQAEDDGREAIVSKPVPKIEVLDLSGDDEDCEMVYTGPKITKLAPIQLESDSDKDQRADSSSPPSASTRSKTRVVSDKPGSSADPPPSTSSHIRSSSDESESNESEESDELDDDSSMPMSQLMMDLCRGRAKSSGGIRGHRRLPDPDFTDYTSSEDDVEDKPTSSQKAAAASTSSASAPVDPDGDVVICNVCKCPLVRGAVRLVPCDHKFHRSCVGDWLERRKKDFQNCPSCRQLPTEVRRLKGGKKVRIPSPVPDDATSEDEEMLTGMVFSSDEAEGGVEGEEEEEEESGSNFSDEADPDLQRALQRSLSEPAGEVRHSPEPAMSNPVYFVSDDIEEESREELMHEGEEEPTGEALSRSPTRMYSSDDERESEGEATEVTGRRRMLTRRRQKEEDEDSDARDRREDEEEEEEKKQALSRRSQRMVEQVERELARSRTAMKSRSSDDRAVARGEEEEERRSALSRMERIEMDADERNGKPLQKSDGEMEASEQEAEEEEQERGEEDLVGQDGGEDEEALTDEEIPDEGEQESSEDYTSGEENGEEAVDEREEQSLEGSEEEVVEESVVEDYSDEAEVDDDEEGGDESGTEKFIKEEEHDEEGEENEEEGCDEKDEKRGESTDGREGEKSISQSLPSPMSPYESLPLAPRPQMCSPPQLDFAALAAAQIPPEAAAALAVATPVPPTNSPMEKEAEVKPVRPRFIDKLRPSMYQALLAMKEEDTMTSQEDVPCSSTDRPSRRTRSMTASMPVKDIQNQAASSSPPNSPVQKQSGVNERDLLKVDVTSQETLPSSSIDAAQKPALTDPPSRSPMDSGDNTENPLPRKRLIDKMRPHMYDFDLFFPPGTTELSSSSQPQDSPQEKRAPSQRAQSAPHSSPAKPLSELEIPSTVSPQATAQTNSPMDAGDNMEPLPKRPRLIDKMRPHMYEYFDMMRQIEQREREQQPCSSKDPRLPENMPSTSSALQPLNLLVIPPSSPSPPGLPNWKGLTRTPSVIIDEESTEKARQSSSSSSSPSGSADPYRDLSPTSRRLAEEQEIELISSTFALRPVMELTKSRRAARADAARRRNRNADRTPPPIPPPEERKRKTAIMDEPIPEKSIRRSERIADRQGTSTATNIAAQPSTSAASDPALLRARSPPVQRMSTPEINRILTTRISAEEEANIADATVNDSLKEALDAWYTKVLRTGGRVGKRMLTTAIKLALQNTDAVAKGKKEAWIPNCDWDPDVERTATVAIQTRSRSTTPEDSPPPDDTISRAEFNQLVKELAAMKRRLAEVEKRK